MTNRPWIRWGLIIFILVATPLLMLLPSSSNQSMQLGKANVTLEFALDETAWQQGLSGRPTMPASNGMLFVFTRDAQWPMWMKDMHFPLDIIWLNSDKQIVHIATGVEPATYPKPFASDEPARYVLEVNAGMANTYHWEEGQTATFSLPGE